MTRSDTHPVVMPSGGVTFAQQAGTFAMEHGERILSEVPRTLRRVGLFLRVLTLTIPAFLAGLLVVLWHFAR